MEFWLNSVTEIILLGLGLAGFFWLTWRDTKKAIWLVVFLLPMYLVRVKIYFLPMNVSEMMIWLLFAAWLAKKRFENIEISKYRDVSWSAGLILTSVVLGTIFSPDLRVSLGILKGWFVVPMILALIVVTETRTAEEIKNLLRALAFSVGGVGLIAIFYYIAGKTTFDGRLSAFYLSPNQLAMYLAPGFLISLWFFFVSANRKHKIFWVGVTAATGLAIYLTFSYAAWLAIVIAVGVGLIAVSGKKTKIVIAAAILCVLAVLFFSQIGGGKLNSLLHSDRSSLQSRLMVWQAAIRIGRDNPVIGIGPGLFQKYYLRYQIYFPIPYLEWAVPEPHNIFLAFWLEAGLAGLAGFLWLIVIIFIRTVRLIKKQNFLATVPFAILVCTLVHGLVDTTYFKNDLAIIFWVTTALVICLENAESIPTVQEQS